MSDFNEFAPVPWWAWSGWMKKSEMRKQLKLMKKSGVEQFFIYASYALMHPVFLSDDWWDYVGFTIDECRKLGMKVWIYDDIAWPSGTAAGHVLREHPEHRCRIIACVVKDIQVGGSFIYSGGDMPVELLSCENGIWQPLRLDENKRWFNNTGKVTRIYCFDIKFYNGVELGCHRSAGTWKQRGYIDMLDENAVKCWMQYIYEPYKEKFSNEFGKTLRGFFFDEPTIVPYNAYFSAAELMFFGQGPCVAYTPGLFEKFQKRYGYELPGKIHALFYDTPESDKVRSDYWQLASECMSVAFGKTVASWCSDNGLMLTGHSNAEEPINYRNRVYAAGEIWEMQKYQHIPGADMLFYRTPFRGNPDLPMPGFGRNSIYNVKLPSAIARYSGAKRNMVEAFGVRGGNGIMAEQKDINNYLAVLGVNFVNDNTLRYSMSPVSSGKSFMSPWFKHYKKFYDASTRLSKFAAWGYLDTSIAVLSPETACRTGAPMARDLPFDTSIGKTMLDTLYNLLTSQIDFELIFEEVISDAPVKDGVLAAPRSAFKTVILPAAKVLSETVADKLVKFCQQGGKIVCTGCRPQRLTHRPLNNVEKNCFEQQVLLTDSELEKLSSVIRKISDVKYQLKGDATDKVISALRRDKDEYKMMLSNQGETPVSFALKAPMVADCQALDPDSGKYWNLKKNRAGEFCIELYPEQSLILEKSASSGKKPVCFGIPDAKLSPVVAPQWNYKLSAPNCIACKMEMSPAYGKMAEDPSLLREWIPVDRSGLQDYILFTPQEYPYHWIRTEFEIDGDVPADLKLVLPTGEYRQIALNGDLITGAKPCPFFNPFNYQLDIANRARSGCNTLLIKVRTVDWYDISPMRNEMPTLPPLVLTGKFAADISDEKTRLTKLPEFLTAGDIAPQGFPQYCGEITFYQDVKGLDKCRKIKVTPIRCGSLEMSVNSKNCGVRAWQPYIFDTAGKMKDDTNRVEFKLTTNWGNLLPGGYGGKAMPEVYGFNDVEFFED